MLDKYTTVMHGIQVHGRYSVLGEAWLIKYGWRNVVGEGGW